jgi:hypothetical protein
VAQFTGVEAKSNALSTQCGERTAHPRREVAP